MNRLRALALAIAALLAASAPAAAVERIIQFLSNVTVERSGDLAVTETIRVEAEGNVIRRGIFRDFPTTYTRPDGTRVEVGFHLESVTRDGATDNSVVENIDNGVRIRIGSADRLLPRGQYTYVIRYRTTRQIGFFDDYDELYWNVTGTGWAFPIDMAEARITLPDTVPFRQTAVYTGPQGARGRDATVFEQQPGRIIFRTTRPLPPHHGLTVAAAWQKGVIEPPTTSRRAQYWLEDNIGFVVAILGLLGIVAFYILAWLRVGRDPPAGTIIPLFGPPNGMSPAAVRYVDRMGSDNHGFTAAIINLGVKGHLRIVENAGTTTIEKRAGGQAVAIEEQALLTNLFGSQPAVLLNQVNHAVLAKANAELVGTLSKSYLGKLFANNYGWSFFGFILVILSGICVVFAVGAGHQYPLLATLVMVALFAVPVIASGAAMAFIGWNRSPRATVLLISGLIIMAVVVAGALLFTANTQPGALNLITAVAMLAAGAIGGIGFPWLKAASPEGRKVIDQIEGFRDYLGTAEEDRLNALNPPDKTPELFERFLPYAIALDVQNAWALKFAGVLAAAAAAGAATAWYVGSRDWGNDPVSFADHLGGSLASTISTSSAAPGSSSGSGGGGSSGGGGGGGGGGGW